MLTTVPRPTPLHRLELQAIQLSQQLSVAVIPNPFDVGYWSFYAGQSEPDRAFPEAYDPAVHAGWLQAAVESQR